jgi:hypothetical protein
MMKGKTGEMECLVIPIALNNLFVGEKGIYLDLVAFERKEKKPNEDTHLVKQSFSKAERETMSKEELESMPILGNLRVFDGPIESEPVSSTEVTNEVDDLPF